ncbi:MAG: hypothetical protein KDI12_01830 [Anaerolineae bacterium]|nr:hypothetical protein [Anaerolineae bacterium]
MSTDQLMAYETILDTVEQWPSAKRITLIQDVLRTLAPRPGPRRQDTLEAALGLLANDERAPSDSDIQGWLDAYRVEKYG